MISIENVLFLIWSYGQTKSDHCMHSLFAATIFYLKCIEISVGQYFSVAYNVNYYFFYTPPPHPSFTQPYHRNSCILSLLLTSAGLRENHSRLLHLMQVRTFRRPRQSIFLKYVSRCKSGRLRTFLNVVTCCTSYTPITFH